MSIAHLSYVMCDGCGRSAHPAIDAKAAREIAVADGSVRLSGGRDLCLACRQLPHFDSRGDVIAELGAISETPKHYFPDT